MARVLKLLSHFPYPLNQKVSMPSLKYQTLSNAGESTAFRLKQLLDHLPPDYQPYYKELFALSLRLRLCNGVKNAWSASEIWSKETGECFNGEGRFWHCSNKLCTYCNKVQQRKNRLRLQQSIDNYRQPIGESYRLITLTIPKLGLPLRTTREIVHRAWTLLRKRDWFRSFVVAGSKAEEFTVDKANRVHYHLHLLASTRFFRVETLRQVWTICVGIALGEHSPETADAWNHQFCVVNVQRIYNLSQARFEVTKYITKSQAWQKISDHDLLEIALMRRWSRSFEIFGKWYGANKMLDDNTYLDKKSLSDGETTKDCDSTTDAKTNWRFDVQTMTEKQIVMHHLRLVSEAKRFRLEQFRRRWPDVQIFSYD